MIRQYNGWRFPWVITLGNKYFAVWNISTDSKYNIFEYFLLCLYLSLYSKRPSRYYGFNVKICLKNEPLWTEIFAKMYFNTAHQTKQPTKKWVFSNISAQGGSFFKPIFALKPWDRDGGFEYNKRFKQSKKYVENSVHEPQILPQKPKIA